MKTLFALLLALTLSLSLTACGTTHQPVSDSVESGKDFVIAFDENDMPFSYVGENGELMGYSVDVAREACQRCGWKLVAEPLDWAEKDTVLQGGDVDCIWGHVTQAEYFGDNEDQIWLVFGELYVDTCTTVDSDLSTIPELAGKVVEVDPNAVFCLEGDNASEWGQLIEQTAGEVQTASSAEAAYSDLFAGKCDAVIINSLSDQTVNFEQFTAAADENGYILKTLYSSEDFDSSEILFFRGIGPCFATYNDAFDAMNDALLEMGTDGSLEAMKSKWDNTEWGSLSNCFSLYDYSEEDDFSGDDLDDGGEFTEEDLEDLFGDMSVIEITDEDYQ